MLVIQKEDFLNRGVLVHTEWLGRAQDRKDPPFYTDTMRTQILEMTQYPKEPCAHPNQMCYMHNQKLKDKKKKVLTATAILPSTCSGIFL